MRLEKMMYAYVLSVVDHRLEFDRFQNLQHLPDPGHLWSPHEPDFPPRRCADTPQHIHGQAMIQSLRGILGPQIGLEVVMVSWHVSETLLVLLDE